MWFKKENKFNEEDVIDVSLEEDSIYDDKEYVEGEVKDSTKKKTAFEEGLKDFEDAMNQLGDTIAKGFKKAKVWANGTFKNNDKVTNKLVKILPFMDEEDIHELVEHIMNDDEGYKDLPLVTVFPFLETKDCDRIFLKTIENKKVIASLAPFVSSETLDKLVDEYIAGKVQVDNIDVLYPFLSKESIKKVFNHLMK